MDNAESTVSTDGAEEVFTGMRFSPEAFPKHVYVAQRLSKYETDHPSISWHCRLCAYAPTCLGLGSLQFCYCKACTEDLPGGANIFETLARFMSEVGADNIRRYHVAMTSEERRLFDLFDHLKDGSFYKRSGAGLFVLTDPDYMRGKGVLKRVNLDCVQNEKIMAWSKELLFRFYKRLNVCAKHRKYRYTLSAYVPDRLGKVGGEDPFETSSMIRYQKLYCTASKCDGCLRAAFESEWASVANYAHRIRPEGGSGRAPEEEKEGGNCSISADTPMELEIEGLLSEISI